MCRNITTLRGLEPPATTDEIEAAAVQFVRKVTGLATVTDVTREAFDAAVAAVAAATAQALADLPERRGPPVRAGGARTPARAGHRARPLITCAEEGGRRRRLGVGASLRESLVHLQARTAPRGQVEIGVGSYEQIAATFAAE